MKISYVTTYNALDIHNWSGLGYTIAKALENQNFELDYIGNLSSAPNRILRYKSKFYNKFSLGSFDYEREPQIVKQYAKQITNSIKSNTDIIFSPGSIPICLLNVNKPKVIYTDATFAGMVGFYEGFSNYCRETIRHGNYLEKKALESSKLIIYSSEWAAQSAIDNYNINPEKIRVIPFGANIECTRTLNDIKQLVTNRSKSVCHLLFIGVDWKRKGGDKAVKVASALNTRGIKTVLHIIGIEKIPYEFIPSFILNHGFISKSTIEGQNKLNTLISNCHFLISPSIADCTPVVYSEANSYGLPVISTNVGGINSIIKNHINGYTFSLETNEVQYAALIESVFNNKKYYEQLAYSSFNEYEKRLNWKVTGEEIKKLLNEL